MTTTFHSFIQHKVTNVQPLVNPIGTQSPGLCWPSVADPLDITPTCVGNTTDQLTAFMQYTDNMALLSAMAEPLAGNYSGYTLGTGGTSADPHYYPSSLTSQ